MQSFPSDIRHSLKQLIRRPGFSVITVLTLALGIGATSAILGVVDRIIYEPLPYPDAGRIVTLWQTDPGQGVERGDVAPANFLDWRTRSQAFEHLAAIEYSSIDYQAPGAAGPESMPAWKVSRGFFDVMGMPALIGRTLQESDYARDGPLGIVLGHRIWQSRFGGNRQIVGERFAVDGQPVTIVGVMPPEFDFPSGRQIWLPRFIEGWESQARGTSWWQVVGKLKPGVSPAAAGQELDAIAAQLAREYPATNANIGISAVPLRELLLGHLGLPLMLLAVAAGLVLLVACLNVISMLLAESLVRDREFAVRALVGANRWRVFRKLFAEGSVLAVLGGLAGCGLAVASLEVYQSVGTEITAWIAVSDAGQRAVVYAAGISLAAVALFSLAPMTRLAGGELRSRLQAVPQSAAPGARRFWKGLVTSELVLAVVLLVGAGLLVRSYLNLVDEELGFRFDDVVAVPVWIWDQYPEPAQRAHFVEQTVERLESTPGIEVAGATSSMPLAEPIGGDKATFTIEGRPDPAAGQRPDAHVSIVSDGFLETLAIPLVRGRTYERADRASERRIVLVNRAMVSRHFAGLDPIGRRITYQFGDQSVTAEVIGVVGNVRHDGLNDEPRAALYLPHFQVSTGAVWFAARGPGSASELADAVKSAIWTSNPGISVRRAAVLKDRFAQSLIAREVNLFLLTVFAVTALALAAIGTYGLLAQEVKGRTRELGIRFAVGAPRQRILTMVLGRGIRLTLLGIGLGLGLSVFGTRFLSGFLYGVHPLDGFTLFAIALTVFVVSIAAGFIPGWRAASVDPVVSLRQE